VFTSHDLHSIGRVSEELLVMRSGSVVEAGTAAQVLAAPSAAYTRELLLRGPADSAGRHACAPVFEADRISALCQRRCGVRPREFTGNTEAEHAGPEHGNFL